MCDTPVDVPEDEFAATCAQLAFGAISRIGAFRYTTGSDVAMQLSFFAVLYVATISLTGASLFVFPSKDVISSLKSERRI